MAANLTPQYLEAEAEYKKAQTAEERLACLRKMFALMPKHKASEKLQAELRRRSSTPPTRSRPSGTKRRAASPTRFRGRGPGRSRWSGRPTPARAGCSPA